MLSDRCLFCLSCLSVCLSMTLVYCGQTVGRISMKLGMDQDATWYGGRPQPRWHCVRWGRGEPPPQFLAYVCCGQMAGWIKMALGVEVGFVPGHIVLDGDPGPLPKKGTEPPPQLWPDGWMHQYATWYGGRPQPRRLCVTWGSSPSPKGGWSHPIFGPYLLLPNGCMHQDTTWYWGRPWPRRHCVRWGPKSPYPKGAQPLSPIFGQCPLWPNGWMDQDATLC